MSQKLRNSQHLYLEGIRDGKVREAATQYTGDKFIQHAADIKDGVEGFVEFYQPFVQRYASRDIRLIRSIVDGRYVFLHLTQTLNEGSEKWVTASLFDTDENDKLIEQWSLSQEYVEETFSGRTMVDGPTEIEDSDKTEENKALIEQFCQDILIDGKVDTVTNFVSTTQYDQHNPTVGDGLEGLFKHIQEFKAQGITAKYVKVHRIIGQGNFVVALSHTMQNDDSWCFFDLFRLKDGKIVEHWDIQEKIQPEDKWVNSGKF